VFSGIFWRALKTILVIKPSSLGDIVHALQVIACLRQAKPDVHITWVVRKEFASVVTASGLVERVILFERRKKLRGWLHVMREIRQQEYDVVLDMQGLLRSALWAKGSRSPRKIGRADGREGANWLMREKVKLPLDASNSHAIEILLPYLDVLDVPRPAVLVPIRFSGLPSVRREGETTWVVFPESRRQEKEWPFLLQACEVWLERNPHLTVIALAGKTHEVPESLARHPRWRDYMGKTSLVEMIARIQDADGVIANDSGPMHIAAALNKPLLALFGTTSPQQFGPYPLSNPQFRVVQSTTDRMQDLALDTVIDAAIEHLPGN
jgi:heptosyltransferase-1